MILLKLTDSETEGNLEVLILPTDTRWNDFGYNFHAIIQFRFGSDSPTLDLRASVVPIQSFDGGIVVLHPNLNSWLRRELTTSGKNFLDLQTDIKSEIFPKFITLLQGENAYRKLAEFVRNQILRKELLTRLNDLVTLRDSKNFVSLTDALMQAKPFKLGVMRTGSAFRALHRGRRYLRGDFAPTTISDARSDFSFHCPLRGFQGPPHALSVRFIDNEILSDRIHCLVGRNGTGKSRLLRELILFLGNSAGKLERTTPFMGDCESTAREGENIFEGKDYTRLIAISSDAESIFPSTVRSDSGFEYHLANLHRTEIEEGGTNVLTRLLVDLMRGSDDIGDKSRWQIFRTALDGYIETSDLHLPLLDDADHHRVVTVDGLKWVNAAVLKVIGEQASLELYALLDLSREVRFIRDGKEVRPSSGERMYFRFALNLLSYIDTAFVLVIDEPETHLHPNLVCDFMNLLYEVLTATKSIALVATHSAYMVREVPTHCAHVYGVDKDRIPSENFVYLKTLGSSIESISQAIFGDSNAKRYHRRIADSMASEGKTIDELIQAYAGFVSPELLSQVASLLDRKGAEVEIE